MTFELRMLEPYKNIDNFFINPFGSRLLNTDLFNETNFSPKVDIVENEDQYVISAELPGLKKNEIKIDFKDRVLTISGEKSGEKKKEDTKYLRVERSYGKFERKFGVPEKIAGDKITANYKDGLLEVTLPKKEESKLRNIDVKIS